MTRPSHIQHLTAAVERLARCRHPNPTRHRFGGGTTELCQICGSVRVATRTGWGRWQRPSLVIEAIAACRRGR
jgi:hypothetical protein